MSVSLLFGELNTTLQISLIPPLWMRGQGSPPLAWWQCFFWCSPGGYWPSFLPYTQHPSEIPISCFPAGWPHMTWCRELIFARGESFAFSIFFLTSWDSCQPISAACLSSSERQHNHLVYQTLAPSFVSSANLLKSFHVPVSWSLRKKLNSTVSTSFGALHWPLATSWNVFADPNYLKLAVQPVFSTTRCSFILYILPQFVYENVIRDSVKNIAKIKINNICPCHLVHWASYRSIKASIEATALAKYDFLFIIPSLLLSVTSFFICFGIASRRIYFVTFSESEVRLSGLFGSSLPFFKWHFLSSSSQEPSPVSTAFQI